MVTDVPPTTEVSARVHTRGGARLDAVMDLVFAAVRPRPLGVALDELPRRIAEVFASEVCSLYLLEGHDLVMRGNTGFAPDVLGEVRLAVGEGLTGMAVEVLRPVSTDVAPTHDQYRHFPSLGEERYPAFLAVPVPGPLGAAGALVVQRTAPAYAPSEIELLAALAGALASVVDRARIVADNRPPPASNGANVGTRRVTLPGRTIVHGQALGQLIALRRPPPRAPKDPVRNPREAALVLEKAVGLCDDSLEMYTRLATRRGLDGGFFGMYRTMLDDARLRERTLALARGNGLVHALAQVAREATRAARLSNDALQADRAADLSELCDVLRVLVLPEAAGVAHAQAVWVGDHLTVFDLLMAVRSRPSAVVLAEHVPEGRPRVLCELLEVPVVAEIAGLFHWVSDGDVALVDGDHGLVRVNPTRRERDAARQSRVTASPPPA